MCLNGEREKNITVDQLECGLPKIDETQSFSAADRNFVIAFHQTNICHVAVVFNCYVIRRLRRRYISMLYLLFETRITLKQRS